MSVQLSPEEFEALVGEALDLIPPALAAQMDNVVIQVEPEPAEDGLLGLYEGVPLTDRMDYSGILPDRITIYRGPILRMCDSRSEVVSEVRITVVHEVAHHFGIEDDELHDLGWA